MTVTELSPGATGAPRGASGRRASVLAVVVIGGVYVFTSSPHVLGGDNGELAAVAASGGVPHPPGYPLFVIVQRALSWIPAETPAHRAALVTALVATLSVATLAWAARAWGASRASSTLAALLFATGPLAWDLATHAEVFTLNVLVAMGIVGLSSPSLAAPRGSEAARAALLALLAGIGLANHHSIVLLAPLGLFAFVRAVLHAADAPVSGTGDRRAARSGQTTATLRALALSVAGLAIGLSPYAYLVWVARRTPPASGCIWGDPRDLDGLVHHFLRSEYGTSRLGISDATPQPFEHMTALAGHLFRDLAGAPIVLVMGAIIALRARDRQKPWRAHAALGLLVASFVLAGPVFVSRFNLPEAGLSALVTERFALLPLALASVLLALALDACARAAFPEDALARRGTALVAAGLAVVLGRAALSYPEVRDRQRPTIDLWLHDVLAIVPPGAIILHSGDDRIGALLYARCAEHARPDVVAIAPRLLLTTWYPVEISARLGFEVVRGERREGASAPSLASGALVAQLLATGRPVFVTDWFARNLAANTPSYPIGPLVRVLAKREDVPSPEALAAANEAAFAAMKREPTLPAKDTWAGQRIADYARPWLVLADAFAARGDAEAAERYRARARAFTPTSDP